MKTRIQFGSILKGALLVTLLIPTLSSAQKPDYKKELDIIFETFKTDNYELIKPLLTDDVFISDKIPVGMNDQILPMVLEQIPAPESYSVVKSETLGNESLITTEYHYSNGRKVLQYFTFNTEGKIIKLDILRDAKKVETTYVQH